MRGLFVAGLLLVAGAVHADDDFGVTASAGTLGFGLELSKSIPFNITGRLGINGFDYDFDDTVSGIDYDSDLSLQSISALVDWRPIGSVFRLTGGVLYNMNEIESESTPAGTFEIGGSTFTGQEVGTLSGEVAFEDYAPYAGLGLNVPIAPTFRLTFDLGVLFQGSPDVSLSASGPIATDPTFQQELAAEEQAFQDDVDDFEFYPVLSIGVRKHF